MNNSEFRCGNCGGTFIKGWTEAEARAEQAATWQPQPGGEAVVCDDCFQDMLAWAEAEHPEYLR